jgi:hypothetical protein
MAINVLKTFQLFARLRTLFQSTTTTITLAINADAISCIINVFGLRTIPSPYPLCPTKSTTATTPIIANINAKPSIVVMCMPMLGSNSPQKASLRDSRHFHHFQNLCCMMCRQIANKCIYIKKLLSIPNQ